MSSYSRISAKRKKVSTQDGLRRLIVRDRSMAGMPKILEVWVPEVQFQAGPHEVSDRAKAAAAGILDRAVTTMEVEVMT